MHPITLAQSDDAYPGQLRERLGTEAPPQLALLGNAKLLAQAKTALFCSARCPGSAVLRAYDQAAHWRDTGRCVISGFHSDIEAECLRILLRGTSPVIICPARNLPIRLTAEWLRPLTEGRLLFLSAFENPRPTTEIAARRNLLVAALADEAWFAHITPGGQSALLSLRVATWAGFSVKHPSDEPKAD
jgi:predicted Rossmann fold nucleotide-binding protein DprA/Smf involved in DNA uptake